MYELEATFGLHRACPPPAHVYARPRRPLRPDRRGQAQPPRQPPKQSVRVVEFDQAATGKRVAREQLPQRARGNEINTAKRLLKIGFAPVDLLYSESLTKVTKDSRQTHYVPHVLMVAGRCRELHLTKRSRRGLSRLVSRRLWLF